MHLNSGFLTTMVVPHNTSVLKKENCRQHFRKCSLKFKSFICYFSFDCYCILKIIHNQILQLFVHQNNYH